MLKNFLYLEALLTIGYLLTWACLAPRERTLLAGKPLLFLSLLTAAIFFLPNVLTLNIVFLAAVPAFARSREEVGFYYLAGLLSAPEIALLLQAGGLDLFTWSNHVSLAVGALLALMLRGRGTTTAPIVDASTLILYFLLLFVASRDTSWTNTLRQAAALIFSVALPSFVVTRSIVSREAVRRAMLWLSSIGAMLGVICTFEAFTSWPLYLAADSRFGIQAAFGGVVVKFRSGFLRSEGPMGEANSMAIVLVILLLAIIFSRRAFRSWSSYAMMIAVVAVGLVAPQSRGAWLGLGFGLAIAAIYRAGKARTSVAFLVGAAAAVTIVLKFWSASHEATGTVDYRERLWRRGMEEFWKSPWIGESYPKIVARLSDLRQGEGIVDFVNSYLYFALLAGIVGAIAFSLLFFVPLFRLWRNRKRESGRSPQQAFVFSMLAALALMFTFASFTGRLVLLVVFASGLSRAVSRRVTTARSRSGAPRYEMSPSASET